MSRHVPGPRFARVLLNVFVMLFALLLTHVFLVRVPSYLVARSADGADRASLLGPEWSTRVEAVAPRGSGAAGGPVPDGVPAAPDHD